MHHYLLIYCDFTDDMNGRMKNFIAGIKSKLQRRFRLRGRFTVNVKNICIRLCTE